MLDIFAACKLTCDYPGCTNTEEFHDSQLVISQSLKEAYKTGWRKRYDRLGWYCPHHAKKHKNEVTDNLFY